MASVKLSRSLAVALVMFTPITAAGQDGPHVTPPRSGKREATVPYAVVKRPLQTITRRDPLTFLLPGPYPTRGVILAFGGFFAAGGSWTVVNFDTRDIKRIGTTTVIKPDGIREVKIASKISRSLTIDEVNKVIEEANAVWDPPPSKRVSPRLPPTDNTCDVALFDGSDVYNGYGFTCPPETENLQSIIESFLA
jgi:hypothetical protein